MPCQRCRPWTPKASISPWSTAPSRTWWYRSMTSNPTMPRPIARPLTIGWPITARPIPDASSRRRSSPCMIPELAAAEARRAVEQKGHVAVVLLPMPVNGRYFNAPECDVLWQEITRLGVPLAFHGTSGGASKDYVSNRFRGHPNFRTLNHASAFPLELMLAMGAMLVGGVLEKFPDAAGGLSGGQLRLAAVVAAPAGRSMAEVWRWRVHRSCQPCRASISSASASSALTWMRSCCGSSSTTSATTTSSCPSITRMPTAPSHMALRPFSPCPASAPTLNARSCGTIVYGCMDSQKRLFLPIRRVDMPFHPAFQPIVALIAGILILIMPRLLNYVVAIYLIIIGVLGLLHRTM